MTPPADPERYKNHRFPGEIISHGVWLYYRFTLSLSRRARTPVRTWHHRVTRSDPQMVPEIWAGLRQSTPPPARSAGRQVALGNVPDATYKNALVPPQTLAADAEQSEGAIQKGE